MDSSEKAVNGVAVNLVAHDHEGGIPSKDCKLPEGPAERPRAPISSVLARRFLGREERMQRRRLEGGSRVKPPRA